MLLVITYYKNQGLLRSFSSFRGVLITIPTLLWIVLWSLQTETDVI